MLFFSHLFLFVVSHSVALTSSWLFWGKQGKPDVEVPHTGHEGPTTFTGNVTNITTTTLSPRDANGTAAAPYQVQSKLQTNDIKGTEWPVSRTSSQQFSSDSPQTLNSQTSSHIDFTEIETTPKTEPTVESTLNSNPWWWPLSFSQTGNSETQENDQEALQSDGPSISGYASTTRVSTEIGEELLKSATLSTEDFPVDDHEAEMSSSRIVTGPDATHSGNDEILTQFGHFEETKQFYFKLWRQHKALTLLVPALVLTLVCVLVLVAVVLIRRQRRRNNRRSLKDGKDGFMLLANASDSDA